MYLHLNYIRRGARTRASARSFLGYIGKRPGKDQERAKRILFGHGGPFRVTILSSLYQAAALGPTFDVGRRRSYFDLIETQTPLSRRMFHGT